MSKILMKRNKSQEGEGSYQQMTIYHQFPPYSWQRNKAPPIIDNGTWQAGRYEVIVRKRFSDSPYVLHVRPKRGSELQHSPMLPFSARAEHVSTFFR